MTQHTDQSRQLPFAPWVISAWSEQSGRDGHPKAPARDGVARPAPAGSSEPTRILVIDDEKLIADTLARILNLSGFAASAVYSGDDALAALPKFCPEIVLSDVRMPGRSGVETGILIRKHCPQTRVVLFSGQANVGELIDQAMRDGYGFELWSKPLHPRELIKRLRA